MAKRNNADDFDYDDIGNGEPTKHVRLMLTESEHHGLRILAALAGESMFQHARTLICEAIRVKQPLQRR